MRTYLDAKAMAASLRDSLAARNVVCSHSECLEIVSQQFGFRDWNILASKIDLESGARPSQATEVSLFDVIPVIRILSSREAKEFYIDYLGFEFDWVPGEELEYAQISRSDATLHLCNSDALQHGAQVFIRMRGLEALRRELTSKRRDIRVEVHQSGDDRRELHVADPFGNTLRFSQNNPPGVSNALSAERE